MTSFVNKTSAAWILPIHSCIGAQTCYTIVILCDLIHIYTFSPQACRPWALALRYINQITCACDITINL